MAQKYNQNTAQSGGMEKDIDDRLLRSNQYRDLLNGNIGRSEGANIGVIENVRGNDQIAGQAGLINGTVIGTARDEANSKIYWFVAGNNEDGIYEYDQVTGLIAPILLDDGDAGSATFSATYVLDQSGITAPADTFTLSAQPPVQSVATGGRYTFTDRIITITDTAAFEFTTLPTYTGDPLTALITADTTVNRAVTAVIQATSRNFVFDDITITSGTNVPQAGLPIGTDLIATPGYITASGASGSTIVSITTTEVISARTATGVGSVSQAISVTAVVNINSRFTNSGNNVSITGEVPAAALQQLGAVRDFAFSDITIALAMTIPMAGLPSGIDLISQGYVTATGAGGSTVDSITTTEAISARTAVGSGSVSENISATAVVDVSASFMNVGNNQSFSGEITASILQQSGAVAPPITQATSGQITGFTNSISNTLRSGTLNVANIAPSAGQWTLLAGRGLSVGQAGGTGSVNGITWSISDAITGGRNGDLVLRSQDGSTVLDTEAWTQDASAGGGGGPVNATGSIALSQGTVTGNAQLGSGNIAFTQGQTFSIPLLVSATSGEFTSVAQVSGFSFNPTGGAPVINFTATPTLNGDVLTVTFTGLGPSTAGTHNYTVDFTANPDTGTGTGDVSQTFAFGGSITGGSFDTTSATQTGTPGTAITPFDIVARANTNNTFTNANLTLSANTGTTGFTISNPVVSGGGTIATWTVSGNFGAVDADAMFTFGGSAIFTGTVTGSLSGETAYMVAPTGGTANFTVTLSQQSAAWTLTTNVPGILSFAPAAGTGNTAVVATVNNTWDGVTQLRFSFLSGGNLLVRGTIDPTI